MKIRKVAVAMVFAFSSFAASNVAPSKAELEAMYSKAYRAFDSGNFSDAIKQLDELDARQPDVAESQNLRGVIYMRQGIYDKAEAALLEAVRIDPKFWNARFNLAEIPFLRKDWPQARERFQQLLSSNVSELQGEAAQLIHYKVLLTYLLEGKENMVDSILAKFELSPDTPAMHYANAAIAFQRNNAREAEDWLATAKKNFSPQLNKLFAESLYEVGWLEKPAGQARASIPLKTAPQSAQEKKEFARSRFEQAQQAFQQRDLDSALRHIDEADAAEPNQAATLNLRGEILAERKDYDQAEAAFKKALKINPNLHEAQYNVAQVPFKRKDYALARERFETLFKQTPGGDKNQAAQIIKFKIYLSYLLEGKDSRAQKMMEQFQFTGDTPALYYAQAAWEFKHNNPTKAGDWVTSAKKIYPASLNNVFADSFYDLGWLQSPAVAGPAPAAEVTTAMTAQTESSPAIEPAPLPGTAVASNKRAKQPEAEAPSMQQSEAPPKPVTESPPKTQPEAKSEVRAGSYAGASPPASALVGWKDSVAKEGAAATGGNEPVVRDSGLALGSSAGAPAKPEELPAVQAPAFTPTVEVSPIAAAAASSATEGQKPAAAQTMLGNEPAAAAPESAAPPATALAPERVGAASQSDVARAEARPSAPRSLVIGGLLVAATFLLAWVIVPELKRRSVTQVAMFHQAAPANGPSVPTMSVAAPQPGRATMTKRLSGGPRQVSIQLKASEPSLRRGVLPSGKRPRAIGTTATAETAAPQPKAYRAPEPVAPQAPQPVAYRVPEPIFESDLTEEGPIESVGPVIEQEPEIGLPVVPELTEPAPWPSEVTGATAFEPPAAFELPIEPAFEPAAEPTFEPSARPMSEPVVEAAAEPQVEQAIAPEPYMQPEIEPVSQGQPVPHEVPLWTEPVAVESEPTVWEEPAVAASEPTPPVWQPPVVVVSEPPPLAVPTPVQTRIISPEPPTLQTPKPLTMTAMTEPIQIPAMRTSVPGAMPQPAGAMQTAVQLTFAFEIASVQLTPAFRMGALQVRPTSKIVTMRLAPSQQPQPAMNLQVTFEISKVQPAGGALGSIRLTPTQAQRPPSTGSASFAVAGLQLVPNFEAAPVQLTPSGHSASVLVTAPFQITTVEFSPAFEIASIALNSNSKQVLVQLPGPAPVAGEGATMFEIANLQLTGTGEIGMMQLNMAGTGLRRG